MKSTVFVISEFNPFHFGHLHLINELHREFDTVCCIMSGNYVQRGEQAIAEKYERAKCAVLCGADLVLELPFPFSCLSARDFARSGVYIASSLGGVNLGFATEDDFEKCRYAKSVLSEAEIKEYIKQNKNLSYPRACEALYEAKTYDSPEFLKKPNNILGMEYLRAAEEINPNLELFTIKRKSGYASSSQIRGMLYENQSINGIVPEATEQMLSGIGISNGMFYKLLISFFRLNGIKKNLYGIENDNLKRIYDACLSSVDLSEVTEKASSPLLTNARIRRTLIAYAFDITKEYSHKNPSYTSLLASNEKGKKLLHTIKRTADLPIITKPADYKKLENSVIADYEYALRAERIYELCNNSGNPLTKTPFAGQ